MKIFGSGKGNLTTDSVDLGRLPRKNELVSLLNRLLKNFEGHFKIEGELNKFYKSSGTCPNLGLFKHTNYGEISSDEMFHIRFSFFYKKL